MQKIEIVKVLETTNPLFAASMDLYEIAFPARERDPIDLIIERIRCKKSQLFVGLDNGNFTGFALLYHFNEHPFVQLDYLATQPHRRGKGFGTQFLRKLFKKMNLLKSDKYLLLEAENPETGKNLRMRKKRVAFYKRLGVKQIKKVRYIMPPLSGTESTEMILMVFPEPTDGQFSSTQCKNYIKQLFLAKHHRNPSDPMLERSLESIPKKLEYI